MVERYSGGTSAAERAEIMRKWMADAREHALAADIEGPDKYGAFRGSWLKAFVGRSLPAVVDTAVIRSDLDRAAKDNRRGTLVAESLLF